ncbi:MAG TPA: shikimate kinase [Pyrinomonadaceae bacterium]|nr:shikimate kinase [Pyrinomonadaceae bacterium]
MDNGRRIALTGFMGVGKSSVARHLSSIVGCDRLDLDGFIERNTGRTIADIINTDGEQAYRVIETENLIRALRDTSARILSLGGGTWTIPKNRELLVGDGVTTVWLESTFEHCWTNISKSRKERPLAKNKDAARQLFDSRQTVYCLADWHFIVRPEFTSYEIATQISEQVFS